MPRVRSLPRPRPVPRGPLPTAPRPPLAPLDSAPRRRNCELDVNIRTQITTLRETADWSYGAIHKKFPDIPLSTIKMTCLRSRIRHKEESAKRSGRPKVLDENDRQKILEKIHEEPRVTYDDLLSEVSNKCKKDSIARLLCVEGLKKWRVMKRPYLTPEIAAQRLAWADKYSGYTKEEFDSVFFSDECTIERGIGLRPEYSFIRPKDQPIQGEVQPTPYKGYQIKQMFWASFSGSTRRTGLIPLYGDPNSPRGGVNRFVILDLYRRILPTLLADPRSIFQQDNAPSHTAHIVRDYIASLGREIMIWPPYSPDLNPIENLWTLLKQKIYQIRPDLLHMPNNDATLDILVDTAEQAWQELDLTILENLSESMPRRVQAIIDANGWYTKY
jgi:transposase